MFNCFKKGMSAEKAKEEALIYEKEIISKINGLAKSI